MTFEDLIQYIKEKDKTGKKFTDLDWQIIKPHILDLCNDGVQLRKSLDAKRNIEYGLEFCKHIMPFSKAEVICHALGKERLEQISKEIQESLKKVKENHYE